MSDDFIFYETENPLHINPDGNGYQVFIPVQFRDEFEAASEELRKLEGRINLVALLDNDVAREDLSPDEKAYLSKRAHIKGLVDLSNDEYMRRYANCDDEKLASMIIKNKEPSLVEQMVIGKLDPVPSRSGNASIIASRADKFRGT